VPADLRPLPRIGPRHVARRQLRGVHASEGVVPHDQPCARRVPDLCAALWAMGPGVPPRLPDGAGRLRRAATREHRVGPSALPAPSCVPATHQLCAAQLPHHDLPRSRLADASHGRRLPRDRDEDLRCSWNRLHRHCRPTGAAVGRLGRLEPSGTRGPRCDGQAHSTARHTGCHGRAPRGWPRAVASQHSGRGCRGNQYSSYEKMRMSFFPLVPWFAPTRPSNTSTICRCAYENTI
jgi:hypothetical protein